MRSNKIVAMYNHNPRKVCLALPQAVPCCCPLRPEKRWSVSLGSGHGGITATKIDRDDQIPNLSQRTKGRTNK